MVIEEGTLLASDEYLKVGLHIGTKFRTKSMQKFIYKVRPDGLAVLNIQDIDERIKIAANFLAGYEINGILVVCRRENGWKAVKKFSEITGIQSITGRYLPGVLTNTSLENFMEYKIILAVDPYPDRNIIKDAFKIGIPVIALCDTNNEIHDIDFAIPCNNKGKKSLGLLFWVLAREFLKAIGRIEKDSDYKYEIKDFSDE